MASNRKRAFLLKEAYNVIMVILCVSTSILFIEIELIFL